MEFSTRLNQIHCFVDIFSDTDENLSSFLLLNTSISSVEAIIGDSTLHKFSLYHYYYFVDQMLFTRWHQAYFSDMAENVTEKLEWRSTQQ